MKLLPSNEPELANTDGAAGKIKQPDRQRREREKNDELKNVDDDD